MSKNQKNKAAEALASGTCPDLAEHSEMLGQFGPAASCFVAGNRHSITTVDGARWLYGNGSLYQLSVAPST